MLKNVIAAFQFLTILPIPIKTSMQDLAGSMSWFPLVGVVLGLATGYGYQGLFHLFPASIAAALTILLYILLTRGLHLDGYMDTIDGFCSGRKRERILEIMKEPTVGSFAVLGMGTWFLILVMAIPILKPLDYVFLHMFTRFQVLVPAFFFTYPRESGTGKFFVEQVKPWRLAMALGVVVGVGAVVYITVTTSGTPFIIYGIGFILVVVSAFMIGWWAQRKIGGVTGDVLGFSIEFSHLLLVLWFVCVFRKGIH